MYRKLPYELEHKLIRVSWRYFLVFKSPKRFKYIIVEDKRRMKDGQKSFEFIRKGISYGNTYKQALMNFTNPKKGKYEYTGLFVGKALERLFKKVLVDNELIERN